MAFTSRVPNQVSIQHQMCSTMRKAMELSVVENPKSVPSKVTWLSLGLHPFRKASLAQASLQTPGRFAMSISLKITSGQLKVGENRTATTCM